MNRWRSPSRRSGFSLIELLITIGIMALLASIAIGTYLVLVSSTEEQTTRQLVDALNAGLNEKLESFYHNTRNLAPTAAQIQFADPSIPGTSNWPPTSIVYKRAALLAMLTAMREEYPQQFADFVPSPNPTTWTHPNGGISVFGIGSPVTAGSTMRPVRSAILTKFAAMTVNLANHRPESESSECLYLLLTSGAREGAQFSVDGIFSKFIRDTDGDGLLEFVDAWGQPLRFYRWGADYWAYLADHERAIPRSLNAGNQAVGSSANNLDPQSMLIDGSGPQHWFMSSKRGVFESYDVTTNWGGYYRLHQGYLNSDPLNFYATLNATTGAHTARVNEPRAYHITPLILSAGIDRKFGILDPDPVAPAIDTYNRPAIINRMDIRGGRLDPLHFEDAADNITNVGIQAGRRR